MPLIELSYPVTLEDGLYKNTFPSQRRLSFKVKRIDTSISAISSGVDGKVNIVTAGPMPDLELGDFVCWGSDSYPAQCSKVVNYISSTEVELDVTFISSDASNGFVNFKNNWFLEIRYILDDSDSNDQSAVELITDYTQAPSAINGSIDVNISYPSQLINPDFNLSTELNDGLFKTYKIQYRESWENNRSENWVSPLIDMPILLVLGTKDITTGFADDALMKRFVKGYPLLYSFVHSSINDLNGNLLRIDLVQYDIQKKVISTNRIFDQFNVNGVYTLLVEDPQILDETAFIQFDGKITGDIGQYNRDHYDPAQYDTNEE